MLNTVRAFALLGCCSAEILSEIFLPNVPGYLIKFSCSPPHQFLCISPRALGNKAVNNFFFFKDENRREKEELKQQPKVTRSQTVDKTLYKTMEEFIEASLRDSILDLEDRLWQAGLGVVKVTDITCWRKHVENGIYDFLPHKNVSERCLR